MAYKNILPTTNLTVSDVRDTLGESTNDIGRLCKSAKINKWSKRKPVEGDWPHGGAGWFDVYGYSIPEAENWIGDSITEVIKQWIYKPSTTKFRLGDFRGYEHPSGAPKAVSFPPVADRGKLFIIPEVGITSSVGYATIFDKLKASIPTILPCVGCYMFNKANPAQYFITSTIMETELQVPINNTPFSVGTVIGVVIFLTDVQMPYISSPARPEGSPRYLSARPFNNVTYKEYTITGPALINASLQASSLVATVDGDGNMLLTKVNIAIDARLASGFVGGSYSVTIHIDGYMVGSISGVMTVGTQVVYTYTLPTPATLEIFDPNDITVHLSGNNTTLNIDKHFKVDGSNIVAV